MKDKVEMIKKNNYYHLIGFDLKYVVIQRKLT